MTESAPARPSYTWRRLWLISIAALLAVFLWFVVRNGEPKGPLRTAWAGYETGLDGTSIVGVVTVTNRSRRRTFSMELSGTGRVWSASATRLATSQFMWRDSSNNVDMWSSPRPMVRQYVDLPPGASGRVTVALPQDGRTGHVLVWFGERPRPVPAFKRKLQNWWPFKRAETAPAFAQSATDSPIQCPYVQPDGTIEPPRVLAPESK